MKKLITLLLVLVMALSLAACGGGQSADTNEETAGTEESLAEEENSESKWSNTIEFVDDFGDVSVETRDLMLAYPISGSFSNSATTDGPLSGTATICITEERTAVFEFELKEYDDLPITFYKRDNPIIKIKIDDNVSEYSLSGETPPSLFLGLFDDGGNQVCNALNEGKDVKCAIIIGNSKYNFILESDNFIDEYNNLFEKEMPTSVPELIQTVMNNNKYLGRDIFLKEYRSDFPIVEEEELASLFVNNSWFVHDTDTLSGSGVYRSEPLLWTKYYFTDEAYGVMETGGLNIEANKAKYLGTSENLVSGEYKEHNKDHSNPYSIENGQLWRWSPGMSIGGEMVNTRAEIRKLADGYYVGYWDAYHGNTPYGNGTSFFILANENNQPSYPIPEE